MDKIIIQNLRTRCVIGVFDHERKHPQDVVINVTLFTDLAPAAASDNIDDAVDYKTLKNEIVCRVEKSSFKLIEKLAQMVADCCLEDHRVAEAIVRIDKPTALSFADSVGVEICRNRQKS
jgi:FolB domain-containing protein